MNRLKKEKLCYYIINAEKAFDKLHYAVMMKTLSKLDIEGNFLTLLENIYKNPQKHHTYLQTQSVLTKNRNKVRIVPPPSLFHIVLEGIARDRRQEKEVKRYTVGEKGIEHSLFTDGTIACVEYLKELTTSTKKPSETSKRS